MSKQKAGKSLSSKVEQHTNDIEQIKMLLSAIFLWINQFQAKTGISDETGIDKIKTLPPMKKPVRQPAKRPAKRAPKADGGNAS